MKRKAQSSFEFLSVFAMGILLIAIIGAVFFTYSLNAKESLDKKQLEIIGFDIISNAENVFFLGLGNRITQEFNFPEGVLNLSIHKVSGATLSYDYLNITYLFDGNEFSEFVYANENYIRFNCTDCHFEPINASHSISFYYDSDFTIGTKKIRIESKGDWVNIDFVRE